VRRDADAYVHQQPGCDDPGSGTKNIKKRRSARSQANATTTARRAVCVLAFWEAGTWAYGWCRLQAPSRRRRRPTVFRCCGGSSTVARTTRTSEESTAVEEAAQGLAWASVPEYTLSTVGKEPPVGRVRLLVRSALGCCLAAGAVGCGGGSHGTSLQSSAATRPAAMAVARYAKQLYGKPVTGVGCSSSASVAGSSFRKCFAVLHGGVCKMFIATPGLSGQGIAVSVDPRDQCHR